MFTITISDLTAPGCCCLVLAGSPKIQSETRYRRFQSTTLLRVETSIIPEKLSSNEMLVVAEGWKKKCLVRCDLEPQNPGELRHAQQIPCVCRPRRGARPHARGGGAPRGRRAAHLPRTGWASSRHATSDTFRRLRVASCPPAGPMTDVHMADGTGTGCWCSFMQHAASNTASFFCEILLIERPFTCRCAEEIA